MRPMADCKLDMTWCRRPRECWNAMGYNLEDPKILEKFAGTRIIMVSVQHLS